MTFLRGRTLPVLLTGLLLVGGADLAAYAATGDSLLLGQHNKSGKTTTVKSAKGPALALKTKKTAPPFTVSSKAKVAKLNADSLDGIDSSALRTRVHVYPLATVGPTTSPVWQATGLPRGTYQASFSVYSSGADPINCGFTTNGTSWVAATYGVDGSGASSVTATAPLVVEGAPWRLQCFSASNVAVGTGNFASSMHFERVDQVVTGTPATSRQKAPRAFGR